MRDGKKDKQKSMDTDSRRLCDGVSDIWIRGLPDKQEPGNRRKTEGSLYGRDNGKPCGSAASAISGGVQVDGEPDRSRI